MAFAQACRVLTVSCKDLKRLCIKWQTFEAGEHLDVETSLCEDEWEGVVRWALEAMNEVFWSA